MIDWLRSLLMIFYAPSRGMRAIRDRSLAPMAFIALGSQVAYGLITKRFAGAAGIGVVSELSHAVKIIAVVAMVLVPILTLVANMFDRRGSFRVVITQEYAPLAATIFYSLTAANIFAILIATLFHYSGIQANYVAYMLLHADESRAALPAALQAPEFADLFKNPVFLAYSVVAFFHRILLAIGVIFAVRETFRMSTARAFGVSAVACFAALFV